MNKILIACQNSILKKILFEIKQKFKTIRLEYKTHDYSKRQEGIDYFFEPAQKEAGWYFSSQGNVQEGDRLILQTEGKLREYKLEAIKRYSDQPSMFRGLLKEIKEDE